MAAKILHRQQKFFFLYFFNIYLCSNQPDNAFNKRFNFRKLKLQLTSNKLTS